MGIDHGFSFPLRYFETHQLKPDWPMFPGDFQRHWPTDGDHTFERRPSCLKGAETLSDSLFSVTSVSTSTKGFGKQVSTN